MTDDHDRLTRLEVKVDQLLEQNKARGQQVFVLASGVGLALINAFLERFSNGSAMTVAEGIIRIWF